MCNCTANNWTSLLWKFNLVHPHFHHKFFRSNNNNFLFLTPTDHCHHQLLSISARTGRILQYIQPLALPLDCWLMDVLCRTLMSSRRAWHTFRTNGRIPISPNLWLLLDVVQWRFRSTLHRAPSPVSGCNYTFTTCTWDLLLFISKRWGWCECWGMCQRICISTSNIHHRAEIRDHHHHTRDNIWSYLLALLTGNWTRTTVSESVRK